MISIETSSVISFTVHGEPCGKGRPRVYGNHAVTPEKTKAYEELVQMEYMAQVRDRRRFNKEILLEMRIYAYYEIPKTTPKWQIPLMKEGKIRPLKKADWDNIGKIIADSLNGVAYHDDEQIVDGMVRKFYSTEPRVEVEIKPVSSYSQKISKKDYKEQL